VSRQVGGKGVDLIDPPVGIAAGQPGRNECIAHIGKATADMGKGDDERRSPRWMVSQSFMPRPAGGAAPCKRARTDQAIGRFHVGVEMAVVFQCRDNRAQGGARGFERGARRQRGVEIDALRGGQKLDPQNGSGVFRHVEQAARAMGGHGNVVFLIGRGGDGSTLAG
jgi:hypothetical protein